MTNAVHATATELAKLLAPAVTTQVAAAMLGIECENPRRSLTRLARMGSIDKPVVVCGRYLWPRASLIKYVERCYREQHNGELESVEQKITLVAERKP